MPEKKLIRIVHQFWKSRIYRDKIKFIKVNGFRRNPARRHVAIRLISHRLSFQGIVYIGFL